MATSSSNKRFLSGDDLAGLQHWSPPRLFDPEPAAPMPDAPSPEPEDVPGEQAVLPTAQEIEAIQQQAYEEGFERGREQGFQLGHREALEEGRKQLTERIARLNQLMGTLAAPFKELDEQVERELLALVVAMVRQLVRREVRTDPQQIIGVVREALSVLPVNSRNIRVMLHPEDATILRQFASGDGEQIWQVVEDPVLQRGGCRVVTETSRVDATLESRLNTLIVSLLGGLRADDQEEED